MNDDLISRQQAIDAIMKLRNAEVEHHGKAPCKGYWELSAAMEMVRGLPSAQLDPKWAEYAHWSRMVENMIEGMPFAEPEKRTEERTETHACDLVSRQAAITIPVMPKEHRHYQTNNLDDAYDQGWFDLQNCIEQLPSAEPEIIRCVEQLPSAQPETGRWIEDAESYYKAVNNKGGGVNENTPFFMDDIACSECLSLFSVIDNSTELFDYCPHCGARMTEVEHE